MLYFLVLRILAEVFLPNKHTTLASDLTVDNILNAVNRERGLRNLVLLNTNSKLSSAAQSKSDDMQTRHYFAHVDPDGHYVWDKIVAAGYSPYLELGENLAIEFYDTDSLMAAWMNSPTHRANVLQEGFRDQGMGVNLGDSAQGQYHSAIANTFGTLAASASKPKPVPTPEPTPTPVPQNPKPKPTPTPQPTTLGSNNQASSTPPLVPPVQAEVQNTTAPETTAPERQPLAIRGSENPTPNHAADSIIPPTDTNKATTTPIKEPPAQTNQPAAAVVGNENTTTLTDYELNRYLILFAGIALLLLMLSDIKIAVEQKFASLDKKINNLVVLLISIIVIAFMYWV